MGRKFVDDRAGGFAALMRNRSEIRDSVGLLEPSLRHERDAHIIRIE